MCIDIINFYSNSDGAVIPSLGAGAGGTSILDMILAVYIWNIEKIKAIKMKWPQIIMNPKNTGRENSRPVGGERKVY